LKCMTNPDIAANTRTIFHTSEHQDFIKLGMTTALTLTAVSASRLMSKACMCI